MKLPLLNQVCEILAIQPGRNDAVKGWRILQAAAAEPRCVARFSRRREGDRATYTTVAIDGHLALAIKAQRYLPVAAQATQGAVVGEEPVEQACANVVNQQNGAGLTARMSWV